ncbi:hypothetical protein LTR36_003667 [Oleoguttula mirabilis]|uniref:Cytochrome P450 n=1 Tax=Oleoguttula mirabilis TaxID=1507867 RepID=A0AAV9JIP6_9PEZI|nr:hypothetical protein LTR36_003667 [Oleoguttula mirabilis]
MFDALLLPDGLSDLHISLRLALVLLSATAVYYVALSIQQRIKDSKLLPLPPGPTGLPFIGNLLDILKEVGLGSQHLLFEKWARQYGELYKVKVGPFTQYMVNTDQAVKAIFDKPAAVSANRPRWIVSNEHICNQWNLLLVNGDLPRWKHQRKVIASNVGSIPKADAAVPLLDYESLKFLHEVSNNITVQQTSQRLWKAMMRYTYSAFTSQMFGLDIPDSSNEAIHYIHETGTAQIIGTLPGSYIVDIFPVLERLPMALKPWAREGSARFKRDVDWCTERMRRIQHMDPNEKGVLVKESLLSKTLEDHKNLGFETKEEGAYLCLMLTIGAADTSQVSTWGFLEAMLRYPDIQSKAQGILDEALGDRLPTWDDYERIPYIRCLVKETWRWRPPVGLGHPHVTTDDIVYNNMRIPKGSRVHLNGWALGHDPARHKDPDSFLPERYESDHTSALQSINSADVNKRDHFAFGAGRRICPGYNVAERSLALAIMRMLWAFDVKPSPHAKFPLTSLDWRGTFPGLPGPDMPITMVPRSQEKVRLIGEALKNADTERVPMQPM